MPDPPSSEAPQSKGWWDLIGLSMPDKVEKAAKETKSMFSKMIESASGGYIGMIATIFEYLMNADPALKTLTRFFETFTKFMEMHGAERAGAMAERLYSEENLKAMNDLAKAVQETNVLITGTVNAVLDLKEALKGLDGVLLAIDWDAIGKDWATMPARFVQMMKDGFEDASSGLSNWFEDWFKEMIEDAGG